MNSTFRTLALAGILATGVTGGVFAATATSGTTTNSMSSPVMGTTGQTINPDSSENTMSSIGSTTASGAPYVTSDGQVGPAAPTAAAKIGGGSDTGGGASR